ncbi:hypothetical protein FHS83_001971 [Rhizomicrobium palustre]|uniref:Lipoprotein n=1 Tax=Rhizomicrobium palustre TaxID=189966 RepID=A0A846MZB3_9PROT|nr:hypothetical protein [Rhizomicrobium palustre]NIK88653.1 hypothetical protein [Rhizomicrobium palustre]
MAKRIDARPLLVLAAALAGCVNFSPLDDLESATPPTDPYQNALYKNYAFLARSFGQVGQAQYGTFDQEASLSLAKTDDSTANLANAYADKAMKLTRDEVVDPEPSLDIKTHEMRDRLVRAMVVGREVFPRDAARAQADWDCWHLNATVASLRGAADACRKSFEVTLPRLEAEVAPVVAQRAKEAEARKKAGRRPTDETMDDSERP